MTTEFPQGTFLAPLLKMYDAAYGTIGGMVKGSKDRRDCAIMPAFGELTSSYDLVSGGSRIDIWEKGALGTLKNKHYMVGLAATHFINMRLKAMYPDIKETVRYFVDPSNEADEDSVEIIYFGNWILYNNRIKPCDFVVETRRQLDEYIKVIVDSCVEVLNRSDDYKLEGEELERIEKAWVEFSTKYYEEANEVREAFFGKEDAKDKEETKPTKSSASCGARRLTFARAGLAAEWSHIVDHATGKSLCGVDGDACYSGSWIYDGSSPDKRAKTKICKACTEALGDGPRIFMSREDALKESEASRSASRSVAPSTSSSASRRAACLDHAFPAYYVGDSDDHFGDRHLALRKDDVALCGAVAKDVIGREEWDYTELSLTVCSKCNEVCDSGGFSDEEHESVAPLLWSKYPTGNVVHLSTEKYGNAVCGASYPSSGWAEVVPNERYSLCTKCVLAAAAKDLTFPGGFVDVVADVLEDGKD